MSVLCRLGIHNWGEWSGITENLLQYTVCQRCRVVRVRRLEVS